MGSRFLHTILIPVKDQKKTKCLREPIAVWAFKHTLPDFIKMAKKKKKKNCRQESRIGISVVDIQISLFPSSLKSF